MFPRNREKKKTSLSICPSKKEGDEGGSVMCDAMPVFSASDGIPRGTAHNFDGTGHVIARFGGGDPSVTRSGETGADKAGRGRGCSSDVAPKILFFTSSSSSATHPRARPLVASVRLLVRPLVRHFSRRSPPSARNRSFAPRPRRRVHQKQCRRRDAMPQRAEQPTEGGREGGRGPNQTL